MIELPFQKLLVWQKGMQLVELVYALTKQFPREEIYGLTSQLRRCGVSIPSNIAEGSQRGSDRDFANFILIAKGSLAELQTQILIAKQQRYAADLQFDACLSLAIELDKMLRSFYVKLTKK